MDPNKPKSVAKSKPVRSEKPKDRPPKSKTQNKPKRTPKVHEVTSPRLYVGNLSYDAGEDELEDLFRGVGNVVSAEVVTNSRTQQSKGFAFVEMTSIEEAKRAVKVLHDQEFKGRKLTVSGAKSDGPREPKEESSDSVEAA